MSRRLSIGQRVDYLRASVMGSAGHLTPDNPALWSDYDGVPAGKHQVPVSAASVVQIPEVYCSLHVISEAVAALPIDTYERKADGSREKVDHPLTDLLKYAPNPNQTALEFRGQMTWDLCLHRNAYAEIEMGPRGPVDTLWRLDPERLSIIIARNGRDYIYEHLELDGTKRKIDPDNVMHLRALPLQTNGLVGLC
jgi:HK97 family phage portal protein